MAERYDFGNADLVDVESVGKPGNRRFRLFAQSARGLTASLWMEREQMEALAVAIDQLLAQVSGRIVLRPEAQVDAAPAPHAPPDFPQRPDIEFQVGQMQLGYDEEEEAFVLRAAALEDVEPDDELEAQGDTEEMEPAFAISLSQTSVTRLSIHITAVLSGGRPRCPLCGRPMSERHVCEKQNGYHPVSLN